MIKLNVIFDNVSDLDNNSPKRIPQNGLAGSARLKKLMELDLETRPKLYEVGRISRNSYMFYLLIKRTVALAATLKRHVLLIGFPIN